MITITYINEGEVRHQSLYLANYFGFGGRIKRFQHDIKDGLLLWFLLQTDE